jgi:hypothetical protein
MRTTLATVEREFQNLRIPNDSWLTRKKSACGYMKGLIQHCKPKPFSSRVAEFSGPYSVKYTPKKTATKKVLTGSGNKLKELIEATSPTSPTGSVRTPRRKNVTGK